MSMTAAKGKGIICPGWDDRRGGDVTEQLRYEGKVSASEMGRL